MGTVISDLTNHIRLVEVKDSSPTEYMTLRSVSKQAIYDASMQKHLCGERDIYISLYEKNALVPHVCGMNTSETDIHLLYNSQVVGDLDTFLDGQPHGESFVRFYAAQVVLALEFLHSVRTMVGCTQYWVLWLLFTGGYRLSCSRSNQFTCGSQRKYSNAESTVV